jgi:acyl-coenzyme A synthetase/AMP-(fatty) acid ligase
MDDDCVNTGWTGFTRAGTQVANPSRFPGVYATGETARIDEDGDLWLLGCDGATGIALKKS